MQAEGDVYQLELVQSVLMIVFLLFWQFLGSPCMRKFVLQLFISSWCLVSMTVVAADQQSSVQGVKANQTVINAPQTRPLMIASPNLINQDIAPKSKQELVKSKLVNHWTKKKDLKGKPAQRVQLTPKECQVLGGKLSYWDSCESAVLCTVDSHVLCIDGL